MKITMLGCGTSGGVPRVGNLWGKCDPKNPKNRRRRVSVLVEVDGKTILIDTSPDLREQLLDADVRHIDAVLYTHDHADHSHGIDDLRGIFHMMGRPIDIHGDVATLATLQSRFSYIFNGFDGYPAIARGHVLTPNVALDIAGVRVTPFLQQHGNSHSIGYRIGDFAYSTDLNAIPRISEPMLETLDLWIVDALRYDPHPTHPHLAQTLAWIERFKPRRAVLTHMAWDLDYTELQAVLPPGVEPGYDGLSIVL